MSLKSGVSAAKAPLLLMSGINNNNKWRRISAERCIEKYGHVATVMKTDKVFENRFSLCTVPIIDPTIVSRVKGPSGATCGLCSKRSCRRSDKVHVSDQHDRWRSDVYIIQQSEYEEGIRYQLQAEKTEPELAMMFLARLDMNRYGIMYTEMQNDANKGL